MRMKFLFIINPNSGVQRDKSTLTSLINKYFFNEAEIVFTQYAGHAAELTDKNKKHIPNIIAVGGDGTLNEVASQLIGTNVNLGLVPMGSGNGFARALGIPLNVEQALKNINAATVKRIDVGKVNKHYFFAIAGVGFDAVVAKAFERSKKRGLLPYVMHAIKSYFTYSYPTFEIMQNGRKEKVAPLSLTIANSSQFGNGATIAPTAVIDDGLLDLCIVNKMPITSTLSTTRHLFNGTLSKSAHYQTQQIKKLTLYAIEKHFLYHTDGEPHLAEDVLTFSVIPNALNIIVK